MKEGRRKRSVRRRERKPEEREGGEEVTGESGERKGDRDGDIARNLRPEEKEKP